MLLEKLITRFTIKYAFCRLKLFVPKLSCSCLNFSNVISMMIVNSKNVEQVIIISTTIGVIIVLLVVVISNWIFWKHKLKTRYENAQIQQSKKNMNLIYARLSLKVCFPLLFHYMCIRTWGMSSNNYICNCIMSNILKPFWRYGLKHISLLNLHKIY